MIQKSKDGINPHLFKSTFIYAIASIVFGFIALWVVMVLWPELSPTDPETLMRVGVEKYAGTFIGLCIGCGLIMLWDWKTNGNLIGQILQTSMACAVFAGSLFLGTVLLVIYL
jgi:hypothetical protein